ncbi:MAG: hypothetical protein Q4D31_07835 [Eubacteriales bacterium]|nr:hypothetical protein [Eubacteriales bacterium]
MQWGKVKNILIAILLAVDLFLLGDLGLRLWQHVQYAGELEADLRTLLHGYGIELDEGLHLPKDTVLPTLSLDRSRAEEEAVAVAMLGGDAERTEQEDGTVRLTRGEDWVEWRADGTVQAVCATGADDPDDERAALRLARRLLGAWGLQAEDAALTAGGQAVTLTGTVAGLPVHDRALTLTFLDGGRAALDGRWSFGVPYTTVRANGTACLAADALLDLAARQPDSRTIYTMTVGYRMQTDGSRRIQLVPTWKIVTDRGGYLVDCAKKTVIAPEN